ncbi:MAG: AbrB/MazE/SpoVT family DNA-binding domain-containing protein [Defluviitaleaceae bacterium]|nr:AbrB/MazE/SpoVT family DNA-binding domain-containing protein [Defluviitaleaceae bacterium]
MENICAYHKIDELGRIMLPHELRELAGLEIGDSILMLYNDETGTIALKLHKKYADSTCALCGK